MDDGWNLSWMGISIVAIGIIFLGIAMMLLGKRQ